MGTILQQANYNDIRIKLGVDTNDLSDLDIDSIGLLPIAEAQVQQLVTDYATILANGGVNKIFLQAATINLCAALAINKIQMQRAQSYTLAEYSESELKVDWEALRASLLEEGKGYLMQISTHTRTRRTLFAATGPTSSASSWPSVVDQWYARLVPHVINWLKDGDGFMKYGWENQP